MKFGLTEQQTKIIEKLLISPLKIYQVNEEK